jgi:hypothetical protein
MAKVEVSTADQKPDADDADRLSRSTGAPIPTPRRSGHPLVNFWRSAVGKKWVMALSGIALLGFVLGHMVGNLKIYLGPTHLNVYAEWLRNFGEPFFPRTVVLWVVRVGLIAAFVLHIVAAAQLTRMNQRARGAYQAPRDYVAANRVPHDALEWRDHRPVPDLPPADLTRGFNPTSCADVSNVFASFERSRSHHLHHRQHRPGLPHLPGVEHVPEPGLEQPSVQPLAPYFAALAPSSGSET